MTTVVSAATEFLESIFGLEAPGWISVFGSDGKTRWARALNAHSAALMASKANTFHDVWYGVGLRSADLGPNHRGGLGDVLAIPGFWVDIDIAGPAHKEPNLPPSLNAAQTLLYDFPLDPTFVVHSGHGLQVYWLFKELWIFEDDAERRRAEGMSRRFQAIIRNAAAARGWRLDNTADLARILRLPGTFNRKLDPVQVRVIELDGAARYSLDEIEAILPDEEQLGWVEPPRRSDESDFPPAYLERILPQCAWLRHTVDDAATLREPEWYAQAGIIGRCEDGARQFHEISSVYPRYSVEETDRKLAHALKASSARTCKYIRSELGGEPYCAGCQHWGTITSPIVLGRPPAPTLILSNGKHDEPIPPAEGQPATFPTTDQGNGERLAAWHGKDLRYCGMWSKWLAWDGRRWRMDDTAEVERRAKQVSRGIAAEASRVAEADQATFKLLMAWGRSSESLQRRNAMIRSALSEPQIMIVPDVLDANPWLLTTGTGTLDLRSGELGPFRREHMLTRMTPAAYDPDASCPTFLAFVERITAHPTTAELRPDLVAFLQRAVGYSLTGNVSERVMFILHGAGANGKSTFLEIIRALLGDYATRIPTETLLARRDKGIPNDIAQLKGARFVLASETDEGRRLSEALVKELTGGDVISARFMRGEWFTFKPEFKLWLATNHKPEVRGTDKAIWDRLCLIPFDVSIPEAEQDRRLGEKLLAELPGILAWAVKGCLAWQRDGLQPPAVVRAATATYRSDMDVLSTWLEESCELLPTATATAKDLYASYKQWVEGTGEHAMSQRALGLRLKERGFEQSKSTGGKRLWIGLRVISGTSQATGLVPFEGTNSPSQVAHTPIVADSGAGSDITNTEKITHITEHVEAPLSATRAPGFDCDNDDGDEPDF